MYKGKIAHKEIIVKSEASGDCGISFNIGQAWTIFGQKPSHLEREAYLMDMTAWQCLGTELTSDALINSLNKIIQN